MEIEIGLGAVRERKVESMGHSKTETTERMEEEHRPPELLLDSEYVIGTKVGAEETAETQVTLKPPHQLPVVPARASREIAKGESGKRTPREGDGEVPAAMVLGGWTEKED